MIVSEMTGIAVENISLVDGDTARVPRGGGTGGSRSLQLAGSATLRATEGVIERARETGLKVDDEGNLQEIAAE